MSLPVVMVMFWMLIMVMKIMSVIVMWLASVAYCLVHYHLPTPKVSEVALAKIKAAWHDNVCDDIYIMMKCLSVCHEK